MKKRTFIFVFMLVFAAAHAQIVLENINSSWSNVMPGKLICEPKSTSYGFVLITDAKNIMSFSNSGKQLWSKRLRKVTSPSIHVLPHDFILVFTEGAKTCSLYNPSGLELWKKTFDSAFSGTVLSGRDGRFFLISKREITCYGITGETKWTVQVPELCSIEPREFNDGTFLVFQKELKDGKTKGLRISPFGEILEEITFTGEVAASSSCKSGILLTFKDSTCAMLETKDSKAVHKWVLQKENKSVYNGKDFFAVSKNGEDIIYLNHWSGKVEACFINQQNGIIEKSFFITDISNVKYCYYSQNGLFLMDDKKAYFYSHNGIELWSGTLPSERSREAWNYSLYTTNDFFVLFTKNWNMNAFRTAQSSSNLSAEAKLSDYSSLYSIDTSMYQNYYLTTLNKNLASEDRIQAIKSGNYGKNEFDWSSELLSACYAMQATLNTSNFGTRVEKSGFETDSAGVELILKQLSLWGSDTYCSFTAYFLRTLTNTSHIHCLLQGVKENAYDPDALILDSLEVLIEKASVRNDKILMDICDAVYEICRFMGRPAYNTKGKQILKNLMYPKYSSNTRLYARETIKKLSDLDL